MNTTTSLSTQITLNDEVDRASVYIDPIILVITIITNILNIIILCRRTLRSSSRSHYFLAFSVTSLIYICSVFFNQFLRVRFGIILASSPVGCQLPIFISFGTLTFAVLMLTFASIDRFFASSSSTYLRNFSQVSLAQKIIFIVTILTIIYKCPYFIIYYWNYTSNLCLQYSTPIVTVYFSSRIVLVYIVAPLAMVIFGLLTIRNIRIQKQRITPMVNNRGQQTRRRTEGQLARMLIIQVGVFLLFSLPAAITFTMSQLILTKYTPILSNFRSLVILWQQAIYFLSFFLYILTASVYRQELMKIFKLYHYRQQISFRLTQFAPTRAIANTITDVRL